MIAGRVCDHVMKKSNTETVGDDFDEVVQTISDCLVYCERQGDPNEGVGHAEEPAQGAWGGGMTVSWKQRILQTKQEFARRSKSIFEETKVSQGRQPRSIMTIIICHGMNMMIHTHYDMAFYDMFVTVVMKYDDIVA